MKMFGNKFFFFQFVYHCCCCCCWKSIQSIWLHTFHFSCSKNAARCLRSIKHETKSICFSHILFLFAHNFEFNNAFFMWYNAVNEFYSTGKAFWKHQKNAWKYFAFNRWKYGESIFSFSAATVFRKFLFIRSNNNIKETHKEIGNRFWMRDIAHVFTAIELLRSNQSMNINSQYI